MKKRGSLLFLIFTVVAIGIIFSLKEIFQSKGYVKQYSNNLDSARVYNTIEDTISANWKTYYNSRLGFTFQYPNTWSNLPEEVEVVDLYGNITAVEINFSDTIFKTSFLIGYHFAPNGAELFKYLISQFESANGLYKDGGKMIEVSGCEALEAFTTIDMNGKGNVLDPPFRLIVVDFLDKSKTGEIQLQFRVPLPNDDKEVAKFRRLLSSFKLNN